MDDIEKENMAVTAQSPAVESSGEGSIRDEMKKKKTDSSEVSRERMEPLDSPSIPLAPMKSSHSTLEYEPVTLSQRRGLLASFALIPEVKHPTAYPRKIKWLITATVALSAAVAPMGSAIVMPALLPIARAFNTTPTITNLNVALYMLSMSIFPLWWSSFSETFGRRTIYITSFALFVIFAVLSAVARNIGMFIVMRLLFGGAGASVQAVGAGTIADIWEPKERGRAMGVFYLGPLCGPLLAPIIGGGLTQSLGWRATQWFLVIYGGLIIVLLVFTLPETLKKRRNFIQEANQETHASLQTEVEEIGVAEGEKNANIGPDITASGTSSTPNPSLYHSTTRQSFKLQMRKWITVLKRCLIDPLKIILLLQFPAVAITVYYSSITFGTLYFLNINIEDTFGRPPYSFSTTIVGLMYIPNSLGYILASIFGGHWIDYIMKREARNAGRIDEKGNLIFRPEDRMRENAWIAACCFPIAMIWYGWSVQRGVFWIDPVSLAFPERNAFC
jgi:multidrug resistance protein